jgi:ParB/RepB/Spo0J family partition protein
VQVTETDDMTQLVQMIPVGLIRPEEGLARKRARDGHAELCRSIAQFGVLTPITVRRAADGSEEYLLVKGQGRTLAARMVGMDTIPAIVVADDFSQIDKVQQFLVENVARLKMRPVDKALLVARARASGEETAAVAKRFGISATTVRRFEAALEDATPAEIAALRDGTVTLALHAVVSRRVCPEERADALQVLSRAGVGAHDADRLLQALNWAALRDAGTSRAERLAVLGWTCAAFTSTGEGSFTRRLAEVARRFPSTTTEFLHEAAARRRAAQ